MKAAILLNGVPPDFEINQILKDRFVVCADGAYTFAKQKKIKVDLIIGDFDSLSEEADKSVNVIKFNKDKDRTDGQLCLDYLIENKYNDIIFLGGGGFRDDHYRFNLNLMYRAFLQNVSCEFYTNYCTIYLVDKKFSKSLPLNSVISLAPFFESAHIIYTKGLKYQIKDKTVYCKDTLTMSNIVIENKVEIVFDGLVLIYALA
ncbi:MAG: thiamine diphosphokinase [Firmicutes bacterium]|nr:thiamine diphosphokinase [Bacillota bacterium]